MQPLSLALLSQGAPTNEKCLLTQTGCKMQEGLLLTLSCVGLALAELSPDGCWPQTYNWQGVRSGEPGCAGFMDCGVGEKLAEEEWEEGIRTLV